MKKSLVIIAAVVSVLAIAGVLAIILPDDDPGIDPQAAQPLNLDQNRNAPPPSDTAEIVERVLPSVVNVRVRSVEFNPFLGDTEAGGQGSGVIVDDKGVIVTNFHVVRGAVDVDVIVQGGDKVEGTVVGAAPEHDLAVIKVEADDLAPIEIGSAEALQLGDDVVAIGFPLGLGGPTVTKGILSGTGRSIQPEGGPARGLTGVLQTDAAINPGNSGGALVDANGRLIGINTAAAGAGSAENIGFAISIDDALPVIEEIVSEPPSGRVWMGVNISVPLTAEVAAQLDLPVTSGVLVSGTYSGTPAEEARIGQGDVIVAIDGERVADAEDLSEILSARDPGDEIEVRLVNASGERTVAVTLEQRPEVFE